MLNIFAIVSRAVAFYVVDRSKAARDGLEVSNCAVLGYLDEFVNKLVLGWLGNARDGANVRVRQPASTHLAAQRLVCSECMGDAHMFDRRAMR